jgi:hypothetical protein
LPARAVSFAAKIVFRSAAARSTHAQILVEVAMLRLSFIVCSALAVAGCGGSNHPTSGTHGIQKEGEACRADSDCQAGLVCERGICVKGQGSSGCDGTNCPCDILKQDCAVAADRCYPTSGVSTAGQCYGAGGQGLGSGCSEPPLDAPTACGKGLICVGSASDPSPGICRAICVSDSGCPTGQRCQLDLGGMTTIWGACVPKPIVPPPPCDPFAQNCPATQMCVVTSGANQCIASGSGKSGSSCTQPTDCAPGLACAALDGETSTAYYFSVDTVFLSRGGGHCMPLCNQSGASCAAGVCSFISGPDGNPRPDAGVCYVP